MAERPLTPGGAEALRYLALAYEPKNPTEVGHAINHVIVASGGKGIGTHGSKYSSGGNIASGVLAGLRKRGLVRTRQRPDGLSGTAYEITSAGKGWLIDNEETAHILTTAGMIRDGGEEGVIRYSGTWGCHCGEDGIVVLDRYERPGRVAESAIWAHYRAVKGEVH